MSPKPDFANEWFMSLSREHVTRLSNKPYRLNRSADLRRRAKTLSAYAIARFLPPSLRLSDGDRPVQRLNACANDSGRS